MSYLDLDENGRWEVMPEGISLHCGDTVELQEEDGVWSRFSIEAANGAYYAMGYHKPLSVGLLARFPRDRGPIK